MNEDKGFKFINRKQAEEMLKDLPGATVEMLDQLQDLTADLSKMVSIHVNMTSQKAQSMGILPSLFLATFSSNVIGAVVDYAAGALRSDVDHEYRANLSSTVVKASFQAINSREIPDQAALVELFRKKNGGAAPSPSDN